MQRSLLPDITAPVEGFRIACSYRPCETLGGDFYDMFRDRREATLMVADAMGHGLEAALLTMLVKAVFHEMAPLIKEIDTLLWVMDAHLRRLIPEDSFVATAVLRLERGSPGVAISNAGLPYPLILRAGSRSVEEVRSTGIPLGLDVQKPEPTYEVRRLELAQGDVLLVCSDGIGSIESRSGVEFGDHHLRRAVDRLPGLSAEVVVGVLVEEAESFGGGRPFKDDVNLIAVTRTSPEQSPRARVSAA
jgi:sigma-B regulation protein RsbU (phosphoserine phosphatase)